MTKHISNAIQSLLFIVTTTFSVQVQGQQNEKEQLDTRINMLFGLSQPIAAKGFNIEGNFFYKRLAFDYSHGASLDFSGNTVTGDLADQRLAIHVPYTTGFGIGYRFTESFNLRIEPKWHQFELYYEGEAQTEANLITRYNTFSLGLGAYYNWLPFKNASNALRGLVIAPSVRYWPTLSSTLDNDQYTYTNKMTGQTEVHERMEAGVGNTPFVFNISVGYSFKVKKKK
jgi:hypothetical protein